MQPVDVGDADPRQSYDKLFYASPVIEMAMRCHFRVVPPRQLIKLHIREKDRGGSTAAATFNGRRCPLDNVGLLRALFARHWWTLKIVAANQWRCDSGSRARAWWRVRTPPSIPLGDREKH